MKKKVIIKAIRRRLRPIRKIWEMLRGYAALYALRRHLKSPQKQEPHGLPGKLVISLTSYKPRFATLIPTLQSLLSQSVRPDRVVLWISQEDLDVLPKSIKYLAGLDIQVTDNLGSYTKIIPALNAFPDAYIVTADDDVHYPANWLKLLLQAWEGDNKRIVCHTAYRLFTDKEGLPVSYNDWKWNEKGPCTGNDLFFLGVGGVFYPPGSLLMPEALDVKAFKELAPKADDVWLNWMARLAGSSIIKTGYNKRVAVWPGSQKVSLRENTEFRANDWQIRNMIERYGQVLGNNISALERAA